jgi:cytochrome c biogenesis protein CcmG, thiol:disulfide interchange protein DsbE
MTARGRRALVLAVLLVGLLLLAVPFLRATKGSTSGTGGQPGQQAPLFASTDLSGRPVALATYRGHRVILNFWASWCEPCRAEFPVLRQMLTRHPDVVVLGVVFQDSDDPARAFLSAEGATWPGVRDPKAQIADAYGVHAKPGIPVSILIDPTGRVVDRRYGPFVDQASVDAFVNHV